MSQYSDKMLAVKVKDATTDIYYVYYFGKPNQDGIRSVEREDGELLGFFRCKIVHLEVGHWLALNTLDETRANWFAGIVEDIVEIDE